MNLFVYGSLKKGFFNHGRFGFGDVAKFIDKGTAEGVSMTRLDGYPYPHAFEWFGGQVKGELYELDDQRVADAIERMEIGAGYMPIEVMVNGIHATMYVANEDTLNDDILDEEGLVQGQQLVEWQEVA